MPKLSNVWKAVGKTINLAQSQSYQVPRKPPLNSLVFEKLPDAKCVPGPKCDAAATKPLRLCSKEELKCMYCPPVPCDCKCVPPALTLKQRLGRLLGLGVKAALVGGIINYTYQEGLWSDSFRSSCLLGKFIEKCPEYVEEKEPEDDEEEAPLMFLTDLEPCAPYIPRSDLLLHKLANAWNACVCTLFWAFLDGPGWLFRWLKSLCSSSQVKQKDGPKILRRPSCL